MRPRNAVSAGVERGWTSLEVFYLGRKPYLFAYKAATGEVAVDSFKGGGKGVETQWRSDWSSGWTSHAVFNGFVDLR